MLEILQYPFMQRALLAGILSALLLGVLGVFVVSRKMSFIGDGLAHASLAGVALALLVGWAPVPVAMVLSVILAILIYVMEKKTLLSSDMAIGIVFTSGMALGVLLMHFQTGFQPELISFLFGNILGVSSADLLLIGTVGTALLIAVLFLSKRLTFVTLDPEGAWLAGIHPDRYILMLYICVALAIVMSIQLIGIILVSALLIIPSAISRLFSTSFFQFQMYAIVSAVTIVIAGLLLSFYLDLPSGATIILTGAMLFFLSGALRIVSK